MCHFRVTFPVTRFAIHDEFNGTGDVSSLKRTGMTSAVFPVRPAVAACAILCLAGSEGVAGDASRWDGDTRSAVRLIAGSRANGAAPIRAGIEIRLKQGWHTYWRYPGDAGVPPRFDFTGSQNVKTLGVLYPAPQRLSEFGATVIGYDRDVILPLVVVPQEAAKPVALRLKLDYAVCEKLCVPAEGRAELALATGVSTHEAALAAAQARVPKKTTLGKGGELAIRSVRRQVGGAHGRVVVDVAAPEHMAVDLFAEGPTPEWALPVPTALKGAEGSVRRFIFDLDGAPPRTSYHDVLLTLTAVAGEHAIEVTIHLD
jgi:DsbC/DsbD-like thiol-disulfide interchange protein